MARNDIHRTNRRIGWAFRKPWTGYHTCSRTTARIARRFSLTVGAHLLDLKAFCERIAARDLDRQTVEIHIRIALMNRFNALGTAKIVRAG